MICDRDARHRADGTARGHKLLALRRSDRAATYGSRIHDRAFLRFRDAVFESVLKTELITDGGQPAMWAEPGPGGGMLYVMSASLHCRHIVRTVERH